MAKLIYSVIMSLDGYVADAEGNFDWAAPDEEVHTFFNDLERPIGTHLYGRRMYETMVYWEKPPGIEQEPPVVRDYAEIWQAADKIVYSKSLVGVSSARTQLERNFDAHVVREMKAHVERDLGIGGPHLAAQALTARLVDECHIVVAPIIVGGGNAALPGDIRMGLELLDTRRFRSGFVHLHYRVAE